MPKLRRLTGSDLLKIFKGLGFEPISQRGSHVKLRRIAREIEIQTLVIPQHDELDKGTLLAIIRQASRYIPIQDLKKLFYTK